MCLQQHTCGLVDLIGQRIVTLLAGWPIQWPIAGLSVNIDHLYKTALIFYSFPSMSRWRTNYLPGRRSCVCVFVFSSMHSWLVCCLFSFSFVQVELSYLAQKVSEFDRLSPYTWCVVGNCFSLQKEHDTALRFFQVCVCV